MDGVLSQDEVNALLGGLDEEGGEQSGDPQAAPEAMPYDFANQERIIRARMPTLEIAMDKLARSLRQTLSTAFGRSIFASVAGIGMRKFGSFIKTLPVPASMHIFKLAPLKGSAMVYLEGRLVFSLIDYFFGGPGAPTAKIEGRDFTPIELRLISKVVRQILADFEKALRAIHPLEAEYTRSEINPMFAGIVAPTDLVIKVDLEIEMEHCTGQISWCLPYAMIEPIRDKLSSSFQSERAESDDRWTKPVHDCLVGAEVDLQVNLGRTELSLQRLRNLKTGDTLMLNQHAGDPLNLLVEGNPRFRVYPGEINGFAAVQVVERVRQ